jgi:5'(3')-deoxyribonucleotidase
MKYSIAVDMDGVLHPFDVAFNTLYEEYGGEPQSFDQWKDFAVDFVGEISDKVWTDPRLFNMVPPYEGAQKMIDDLMAQDNVEVFFVTSPGRSIEVTIPAKWKWLQTFFPKVVSRQFVTTAAKWYFSSDIIIEDFPGNLKKWYNRNPGGTPIMIRRPWNEDKVEKMKQRGILVLDDLKDVSPLVRWIVK